MGKRSRIAGAILLMFGLMSLLSSLSKPSVAGLRRVDVLRLVASGACFGVALVGLLGGLKIRDQ